MQPNGEESKDDFLRDRFPSALERIGELRGLMHEDPVDMQFWGDTLKTINTAVGLPSSLKEALSEQALSAKNCPLGHKWATAVDSLIDGGVLQVCSDPVALLGWASRTEDVDSETRFTNMASSLLKRQDPLRMLIEPPLFVNGTLAGGVYNPFQALAKLANSMGSQKAEFAAAFLLGSLDIDIEHKAYIPEFIEAAKLSIEDIQATNLYQDCLSEKVKLNLLTPAEMRSVFEDHSNPSPAYENTGGH